MTFTPVGPYPVVSLDPGGLLTLRPYRPTPQEPRGSVPTTGGQSHQTEDQGGELAGSELGPRIVPSRPRPGSGAVNRRQRSPPAVLGRLRPDVDEQGVGIDPHSVRWLAREDGEGRRSVGDVDDHDPFGLVDVHPGVCDPRAVR
jgi:hypothetical protein